MSKQRTRAAATRQPRVTAGLRVFFTCLILAGIISSAVRLYFSSPRLQEFIESEIESQNPPVKIDFKSAKLTLARGLFPTFAFDISEVKISHHAPCVSEPFFEASLLTLPIDWLALLRGQIKLRTVVAEGVSLSVDRAQCTSMSANQWSEDSDIRSGTTATSPAPVELPSATPLKQTWFNPREIEKIGQFLSGVLVRNGTVYFDQSKKSVSVNYLELWTYRDDIQAEGEVSLPSEFTYGEQFPPITLQAYATTEMIRIQAESAFDEGDLRATLDLFKYAGQSPHAKVLMQAGAMPLSVFSNFLRKVGVLAGVDLHPKFLWLNCDVSSEGPLNRLLKHTPLNVTNCVVEGDAGRIEIGPGVRDENREWQPFEIKVQRFNLKDLYSAFKSEGPSGVLNSFGILQGVFKFQSKDQQSFEGTLEDVEVLFSNRNVRATQKISSLALSAARSNGRVKGKISHVKLSPGVASGEIEFDYSDRFDSGTAQLNANELTLDEKVQSLMADGVFEKLSVNGGMQINNHRITQWQGQIKADQYNGMQLKFKTPIVATRFTDGIFYVEAKANGGELAQSSRWLGWVREAAPSLSVPSGAANEWIPISNTQVNIQVSKEGIQWREAKLSSADGHFQFFSSGEIARDGFANGILSAQEAGKSPIKFTISGPAQRPVLTRRN